MPAPERLPSILAPASLPGGDATLPLLGLTVLAVEDSRFASEALRLLCQRSGARLRRADSLCLARRHLALYQPDVAIIDLGLPDGDGTELIRDIASGPAPRPVLLATSGDSARAPAALAAGAQGFLEKPLESLASFQQAVLRRRPVHAATTGAMLPRPDRIALHDDLAQVASLLARGPEPAERRYVVAFVAGIAHAAGDMVLARAAEEAADAPDGLRRLSALVNARLRDSPMPFDQPG